MVRDEDGVVIFRGSIDGECEECRAEISGGAVGGVCGSGGGCCNIDNRFALRASVGLIVLAPSPVAWFPWGIPGITDILFAEDEGVVVTLPFCRPGDFPAKDEDLL